MGNSGGCIVVDIISSCFQLKQIKTRVCVSVCIVNLLQVHR